MYGFDAADEPKCGPAERTDCKPLAIAGRPDSKHILTSHVERQNLMIQLGMHSFTLPTNKCCKKLENRVHGRDSLHALQLGSDTQDPGGNASHGSGPHRPRLFS
jgi:hypothetical protein